MLFSTLVVETGLNYCIAETLNTAHQCPNALLASVQQCPVTIYITNGVDRHLTTANKRKKFNMGLQDVTNRATPGGKQPGCGRHVNGNCGKIVSK